MTMLLATKTPFILFLFSLLNQNRTIESIFPHKNDNHNHQQYARSLTDHLLASLAGMTSLSNNNNYDKNQIFYHNNNNHHYDPLMMMKQIPFITAQSSSTSWLYQLPFTTGSAQCDQSLMLEPEFHRCRANAAVYWQQGSRSNYQQSSTTTKYTCCFLWDLVDCMEQTVHKRCNYSFDLFRRNRNDYIVRIQSNPLCYNYLYGNWSCMQDNWILLIAFIILAIFIVITICVACWTLFGRNKNKQTGRYDSENIRPSIPVVSSSTSGGGGVVGGYVIDYDHDNHQQQQPPSSRRAVSSSSSNVRRNLESNNRSNHQNHSDFELDDNDDDDDQISTNRVQRPSTLSPLSLKDYEPPRRFHFQQQQQQHPSSSTPIMSKQHHYSVSNKRSTRSPPPPPSSSSRPASVVSVRQIQI
ncbi:hypothetical protein DERP_010758 [Dermatophagoides pteronyssinus]|uniref:Uncharacterized protein n=1 Tax=Dermatophagoides pteronyssinus TaxID=6956 RepID=A0ABQ8J6J5_DERPT|nr:hypothetical protein DERP_010758 [Dermatophagoides pteronyssinus]